MFFLCVYCVRAVYLFAFPSDSIMLNISFLALLCRVYDIHYKRVKQINKSRIFSCQLSSNKLIRGDSIIERHVMRQNTSARSVNQKFMGCARTLGDVASVRCGAGGGPWSVDCAVSRVAMWHIRLANRWFETFGRGGVVFPAAFAFFITLLLLLLFFSIIFFRFR